jgi:crotonobetainyl-CoA:carnitine CoA-transferase CaiB-like acyl-CoA transferase
VPTDLRRPADPDLEENVMTPEAQPLSGVRVVDVTRALAGPFCTMLLGDQGADVIKIERPGVGDDTRHQSNPMVGDQNSAFLSVNRNKKSVELDLQSPRGADLARRLVATADVFVENFRPGKAEALGLGWDALQEINPRLIYCSISGWGGDGPYAGKGGYASTAEALGGLMSVTGEREGEPVKVGVSIIDNLTGLYAKDAITAALLARHHTGRGQKIETSLLESTVSILSLTAYAWLMGGIVADRWGSEHQWLVPWKSFRTADGHLMIACSSEAQWAKICQAMGRPELITDERFVSMSARKQHRVDLYQIMDTLLAERTTTEWLTVLDATGAAAAKINTVDEVFSDPQVLHREMVQSVKHTTLGDIPQLGHAQKFFGTPATIRLAPPLLGEHTDEVLREIAGCDDDQLRQLRLDGITA